MKLEVRLMDFSKSNRNRRTYDTAMLQQVVDAYNEHGDKIVYMVDRDNLFAEELSHPSNSLSDVCGKVENISIDVSNQWINAKIEIIPTTDGRTIDKFIPSGFYHNFALRMIGEYKDELDDEGHVVLDESGRPKKVFHPSEIISVDFIR